MKSGTSGLLACHFLTLGKLFSSQEPLSPLKAKEDSGRGSVTWLLVQACVLTTIFRGPVYVYACSYMWVHTCEGQRTTLGVNPQTEFTMLCLFDCFLQSLTSVEFKEAGLAEPPLGIHLSWFSHCLILSPCYHTYHQVHLFTVCSGD